MIHERRKQRRFPETHPASVKKSPRNRYKIARNRSNFFRVLIGFVMRDLLRMYSSYFRLIVP